MNKAHQTTTEVILDYIRTHNQLPWTQPWFGSSAPISFQSGKRYSFLNTLLLEGEPSEFITWNQIQKQPNAHLRKGSKGHRVFFYSTFDKTETDKDGNTIIRQVPFLKCYTVFNVDDCDGISRRWQPKIANTTNTPIEVAETIVNNYISRNNIQIKHDRSEAFYSVRHDFINIPELSNFRSSEDYYSTLLHEIIHSTGHKTRLGRFKDGDSSSPFGSPSYSREELVAEMGASFLLNQLGIANSRTLEQNAAYIKNWIKALNNDYTLISVAAGRAERAVEYVLGEKQ
ncbi:ArdC family protein [Fibrobacter sp.]|uniref:ArdC family protein n=1 Tax=Fibrobacter sp. TaxID=35828 RepID=UPI00388E72E9